MANTPIRHPLRILAGDPWVPRQWPRGMTILIVLCLLPLFSAWAADVRNELPGPQGLQAVVLQKTITLSWQWEKPEALPVFSDFGFEIKRQDGKTFFVHGNIFKDAGLFPGSYTYAARARGLVKEKSGRVIYISDWSEAVAGVVKTACSAVPAVELTVEPTQKKYASIPSMRFHMAGRATVPSDCTLGAVTYRLDTGTGISHSGALAVDAKGHFDAFVNAFSPEDEIPSGLVSFTFTATAEDQAGPTTASAYTIDVELENRFAPHQP